MSEDLLQTLRDRFDKNMHRHAGLVWGDVHARLAANAAALESLRAMEESGGEPDVINRDDDSGQFIFCDCSAESPAGRRSLCYDEEALASRKKFKPDGSAVAMAAEMGIDMLTEEQYFSLQQLGEFDTKTSSWVQSPEDIRDLGGALFCDRRFGRVFVFHNGAESYYGSRGFRGQLKV